MGIGQAAGTAAALAAELGCGVRDIPIEKLQAALLAEGASLRRDPDAVRRSEATAREAIERFLATHRPLPEPPARGSTSPRIPRL